eukprot:scaffold8818_cov146-Skeletonema_dohrnii-CCMP3373.AAC.1
MSERQHIDIDSNTASPANLSIPQRMICAASAGMTCWAFIYPADVIRSRLYSQSLNSQSLPTTMDGIRLAQQMVRETGYQSLYRGMPISVARAGPVAAAILPFQPKRQPQAFSCCVGEDGGEDDGGYADLFKKDDPDQVGHGDQFVAESERRV